jgi:hypothetical protein
MVVAREPDALFFDELDLPMDSMTRSTPGRVRARRISGAVRSREYHDQYETKTMTYCRS